MIIERTRETCSACNGDGHVVDEQQRGEPIATCMVCKGNGWVYADTTTKDSILQLLPRD
jgi:DnaJ-class molecular chaperone